MQVQEFECQIAKAQIVRYLGGESFDEESLRQLNDHIAQCDGCRATIARRKEELQDRIAQADAVPAGLEEPASAEPDSPSAPRWRKYTKMGAYVGALAVVLFAMNFVADDPTSLFGRRAVAAQSQPQLLPETAALHTPAKSTPPTTAEAEAVEPVRIPAASIAPGPNRNPRGLDGPVGSIGKDGQPTVTVYPPESAIAKAAPKRRAAAARPKPASRKTSQTAPRPSSGIVVYDPEGNVIRPEGNQP